MSYLCFFKGPVFVPELRSRPLSTSCRFTTLGRQVYVREPTCDAWPSGRSEIRESDPTILCWKSSRAPQYTPRIQWKQRFTKIWSRYKMDFMSFQVSERPVRGEHLRSTDFTLDQNILILILRVDFSDCYKDRSCAKLYVGTIFLKL